MKFEKLVDMFSEAKGVQGGNAIFNAKNAAGPKGLSNQSAGFSDNNELLTPKKKWEFKGKTGGGVTDAEGNKLTIKKDMDVQSRAWKELHTAFSLLANDETFASQVKKVGNEFDKQRDGYRTMMGVENKKGKMVNVKYDEESKINSLPATLDKQRSKRTGLEASIADNTKIINNFRMSPSKKFALERRISALEDSEKMIKRELDKGDGLHSRRRTSLNAEYDKNKRRLEILTNKYSHTQNSQSAIDTLYRMNAENEGKIIDLDKKIEKNEEELAILTDRTTKIQANNEEINDKYLNQLKKEIFHSAGRIHDSLKGELDGDRVALSSEDLNWEEPAEDIEAKLKMLEDLSSNDVSVNPIIRYLDVYGRFYYGTDDDEMGDNRVKDLDEREFDPQTNITKMRDYNALPLVRLLTLYSNMKLSKMSLKVTPDMVKHEATFEEFNEFIKQFPSTKDTDIIAQQSRIWNDPETKNTLINFVNSMGIENKKTQYDTINRRFKMSRSGANPFTQLLGQIKTDMTRFGNLNTLNRVKVESFDDYTSRIMESMDYDEDSFKIDMIEILTK